MPLFHYRARNRTGALVEGDMSAATADAVGQELGKRGQYPISIKTAEKAAAEKKDSQGDFLSRFQTVTNKELVLFTRQMSTLFNAGIPLVSILTALSEQTINPKFKGILVQMRFDIEGGLSFSQAMGKHSDVFTELYVSMIEAGETGGVMDEILKRLADLLETQEANDAKIKAAMRYPKIVITAVFLAIAVLMLKVVPVFIKVFEGAHIELPLATRILIAANTLFHKYWYHTLGAAATAFFAFKKYVATETGRRQWDNFKLKFPLLGDILLRSGFAKFARIFGTLQMGGVPILDIIDVSSRVMDNVILKKLISDLRISVGEGSGLAAPLQTSGMVPPLVIQMVAAGEQSGALDQMLVKVADYYDGEVDEAIKKLSAMIEPILMVFMAAIVLFLALAIFLPMWDMSKMAQH